MLEPTLDSGYHFKCFGFLMPKLEHETLKEKTKSYLVCNPRQRLHRLWRTTLIGQNKREEINKEVFFSAK